MSSTKATSPSPSTRKSILGFSIITLGTTVGILPPTTTLASDTCLASPSSLWAYVYASSTIVVAIEAIKEENGKYLAYTDNGREYTGIDVFEWAKKIDELGAGEIVITSVDNEGTGLGFDFDLISKISSIVSVPVIAHGGAGSKKHVVDLLTENTADAVMLSSLFHYQFIKENEARVSLLEGNTEFLKQKRSFHTFQPCTIKDLKDTLIQSKIECRTE